MRASAGARSKSISSERSTSQSLKEEWYGDYELTDPTCHRNADRIHHNGRTIPADYLYFLPRGLHHEKPEVIPWGWLPDSRRLDGLVPTNWFASISLGPAPGRRSWFRFVVLLVYFSPSLFFLAVFLLLFWLYFSWWIGYFPSAYFPSVLAFSSDSL